MSKTQRWLRNGQLFFWTPRGLATQGVIKEKRRRLREWPTCTPGRQSDFPRSPNALIAAQLLPAWKNRFTRQEQVIHDRINARFLFAMNGGRSTGVPLAVVGNVDLTKKVI